ncbi:MAG TPA: protein kinase [Candidatus Saccharimonadales bacterium]|nr:protein kinase [Candidatus Saccharimonadales bacterium]
MNHQGPTRKNESADRLASVEGQSSGTAETTAGWANRPVVPDYELLRRIGGGAYGEVWLARSKATGVLRAAKIVSRQSFDDDRPFQREFEGIQRFERVSREHPSQLSLFHIGRNDTEGYFYYVMELADDVRSREASGASLSEETAQTYQPRTLRADLAQGRLPTAQVLEIGITLTEALDRLHRSGLVHRDVKPSNVIFVNGRPKLADIGLVTDASDTRSIVGTEGYLPPEGPGTPEADIFALGKVLYEAVTGQDRRRFPELPPELKEWPDRTNVLEINEIVLKACGSDAGGRYLKCEEMLAELNLLARGKSVKRQRRRQQGLVVCKKAGWALTAVAMVLGALIYERGHFARSEYSSEGPPSTNVDAAKLCAKGILVIRGDNTAEFKEAYTNFHQAIGLDPHFARPYIGLLELLVREDVPNAGPPEPEELRQIAGQLKKLAPNLAATWCAQAIINWYDWNYPEAQRCALQAIQADPNYELAHTWYGFMLCMGGYPAEGRAQMEISMVLAPSKVTLYQGLGQTYYIQRDFTNAITWERKALELEPHHASAFYTIASAQLAMGDYSNAMINFEQAEINFGVDPSLARKWHDQWRRAFDEGGARGYWQKHWDGTKQNLNREFYWKAVVQVHLGNTDAAFGWLKKSCDIHERRTAGSLDSPLNYLLLDDCWDGSHDDPRFKALLDKIGFTKVKPPGAQ